MTEGEGLGKTGEDTGDRNVILWADHRAEEEAAFINQTGEGVLGFVGGVMSVSHQPSFAYQSSCSFWSFLVSVSACSLKTPLWCDMTR